MSIQSAIRWSSTATPSDQRFLHVDIPNQTLKLCRVDPDTANGPILRPHVLAKRTTAAPILSFDWAPFDESLVAVGDAEGTTTVHRLTGGVDPPAPLVFPSRSVHACTAIAFNTRGLLAAGNDYRQKNDPCLNVWDVNHQLSVIDAPRTLGSKSPGPAYPAESWVLSPRDPVTSIKFFDDRPDILIAAAKGQFLRIYDLRAGINIPSLQFITKCVNNIAINPLDQNYIASCIPYGGGHVSIFDRRSGSSSQFSTVTIGSSSSHPATHTGGGSESQSMSAALEFKNIIPKNSQNHWIFSLRFSPTRSGCLGMLGSDGSFKTFQLNKEYVSAEHLDSFERTLGPDSAKTYPEPIFARSCRDFFSPFPAQRQRRGYNRVHEPDALRVEAFDFVNRACLSDDDYARDKIRAVTVLADKSIALYEMPGQYRGIDLSSQSQVARGVYGPFGAFNVISGSTTTTTTGGGKTAAQIMKDLPRRRPGSSDSNSSASSNEGTDEHPSAKMRAQTRKLFGPYNARRAHCARLHSADAFAKPLSIQDALDWLSIPRLRCAQGYLPINPINEDIVAELPDLQAFWKWMKRARENSMNGSMIIDNLDLNYLGILSVWKANLGPSMSSRILDDSSSQDHDFNATIEELVRILDLPETKTRKTSYPLHRLLCLHMLVVPGSADDLENTIDILLSTGQVTKAAAFALFHDQPRLAYKCLMHPGNGPATQAQKLLAMSILGAPRGSLDSEWEATCSDIAQELPDPYSRAILTLVSKGDLTTVVHESTLPLQSRVEVALRWLPDEELTQFLDAAVADAIRIGDLEAVVLTGMDHAAVDLFQSYIRRTGDVQTAVLALAHTVPRFIRDDDDDDNDNDNNSSSSNNNTSARGPEIESDKPTGALLPRFEAWFETYRDWIRKWKMHLHRARLDIDAKRLAQSRPSGLSNAQQQHQQQSARWKGKGKNLSTPPPQQVTLSCSYCTKPLTRNDPTAGAAVGAGAGGGGAGSGGGGGGGGSGTGDDPGGGAQTQPQPGQGQSQAQIMQQHTLGNPLATPLGTSGTVCPKCGRHMPRCGVCSMWLGVPDPLNVSRYSPRAAQKNPRQRATTTATTTATASNAAASQPESKPQHSRSASASALASGTAVGQNNSSTATNSNNNDINNSNTNTNTKNEGTISINDGAMNCFIALCINCNHGFHAEHARQWFSRHPVCPVAECGCFCDR